MSVFTDRLAADLVPDLLDEFGETVTYRPRTGDARSITAIVERGGPADLAPAAGGVAPLLRVRVANDSTTGISSDEIDTGGDRIDVAHRVGVAATTRPIVRIIEHDAASLLLELR